ncbi:MAG: glycosyltransferase 87 family protein [Polyangiales bacterium]
MLQRRVEVTASIVRARTRPPSATGSPVVASLRLVRDRRAALTARPLYDLRVGPSELPFTYPPAAAIVFVPLALVPIRAAQVMWTLLSLCCVVLATRICVSGFARVRWRACCVGVLVLALVTNPARVSFTLGQINPLVLLAIVNDLNPRNRSKWRGIGIGVVAALKLTPLFVVAGLVATRRWREASVAVATFVLVGALAFVVRPTDSLRFWGGYFLDAGRVGGIAYVSNQSFNAMLMHALSGHAAARVPWLVVSCAWSASVFLFARRYHRNDPAGVDSVIIASSLLVSPVSWVHHYLLSYPIIASGLRLWFVRRSRVLGAALLALLATSITGIIWSVPRGGGREYHYSAAIFVVAHADVICLTMTVLAVAWVIARRQVLPEPLA